MWKWFLIISAVVFGSLLVAIPVIADSSADVTITATGFICGAPQLTVTWITDREVRLDWVMGAGSVNTMVRVKIGSIPTSRTDGYLVYYGPAITFTDTALNLDEIVTYVYYRAWGQNASGVWEEEGDTGFVGGIGMTLLADILIKVFEAFLMLGLIALTFWVKEQLFLFVVSGLVTLFIGISWIKDYTAISLCLIAFACYLFYEAVMLAISNKTQKDKKAK